jgi:hypothetical protein
MQTLKIRLSNQKGFTLILSALLIIVFIGAAAMAVDVGHMQARRAEVHSAADAAALAGIEKFASADNAAAALAEAQLYAGKFKADATTLSLAAGDFSLGNWDVATSTFTSPPGALPTNAARATIHYNGALTFAPALFGHIASHISSATSVAIGVRGESVTKSTCVAPVVLPMADLVAQLGLPAGTTTLSPADIAKLASATAADAKLYDIPNGSQVKSLKPGEFYQVELPPVLTAGGQTQNGQNPSASDFRNAITCAGGEPPVGLNDWLAILVGQDANQAKLGLNNANGSSYPVSIEVAITGNFSTTVSPVCAAGGNIKGCLQVLYLGAFTATVMPDNKGVTGYFTALAPRAGGIVDSSATAGPLARIKTRLVF